MNIQGSHADAGARTWMRSTISAGHSSGTCGGSRRPRAGLRRVTISHSSTPKLYRSALLSHGSFSSSSGAAYANVPAVRSGSLEGQTVWVLASGF